MPDTLFRKPPTIADAKRVVGNNQPQQQELPVWKRFTQGMLESPVVMGEDIYNHLRNQFTGQPDIPRQSSWRAEDVGRDLGSLFLGGYRGNNEAAMGPKSLFSKNIPETESMVAGNPRVHAESLLKPADQTIPNFELEKSKLSRGGYSQLDMILDSIRQFNNPLNSNVKKPSNLQNENFVWDMAKQLVGGNRSIEDIQKAKNFIMEHYKNFNPGSK